MKTAPEAIQYPFSAQPEAGTAMQVAPGIRWIRMPLPFQLNHINLWLIEDGNGWTIVDTGIGDAVTRTHWETVLGEYPEVRRVILTHYHPDHAGNAAWLCQRFGVELWTTQGEYLTAHAVGSGGAGYTGEAVLEVFRRNGLDEERRAAMGGRGNNRYAALVPDFPHAYHRIYEGDDVPIGGREWRAIVGYGHAPEHLSLHCEGLNVLIAGDMLLSTISTNVSVWSVDPEGDPLRLFLQSIARYRALPADVLVLPSHGRPFRGAHLRVDELEAHHRARFAELLEALGGRPSSAADLLGVLFRRPLDTHQTFFAMGEAIAHLHYLFYANKVIRAQGADGIMRYSLP